MPRKASTPVTSLSMDELLLREANMYYVSFLGDVAVIKNRYVHSEAQANKYYTMLVNHTIDMYNEAKSERSRKDASSALMSLKIIKFRIQ